LNVNGQALGNNRFGIDVSSGSNIVIGGTGAGEANVISSNVLDGIALQTFDTTNVKVRKNLIGTDPAGLSPMANGRNGVIVRDGANNVIIGGIGAGNVIAFNSKGVVVAP